MLVVFSCFFSACKILPPCNSFFCGCLSCLFCLRSALVSGDSPRAQLSRSLPGGEGAGDPGPGSSSRLDRETGRRQAEESARRRAPRPGEETNHLPSCRSLRPPPPLACSFLALLAVAAACARSLSAMPSLPPLQPFAVACACLSLPGAMTSRNTTTPITPSWYLAFLGRSSRRSRILNTAVAVTDQEAGESRVI